MAEPEAGEAEREGEEGCWSKGALSSSACSPAPQKASWLGNCRAAPVQLLNLLGCPGYAQSLQGEALLLGPAKLPDSTAQQRWSKWFLGGHRHVAELSREREKEEPAPASLDLVGSDVSLSEGRGMQAAVEMQWSWARVGTSNAAGEPSPADTFRGEDICMAFLSLSTHNPQRGEVT